MSNSKTSTDIDSDEYIEHYTKKKKLNVEHRCSICLEHIKKLKQMHFLPCCHYFHKSCVNTWLETNVTCPECRIPIYIQDIYQYEDYLEYYTEQKASADLVRRNIRTSDNAIAMRFVQNRKLFNIRAVEYTDISKIQAYIYMPELSFQDMYGDMFAEEDAQDQADAEAQEQYEYEQEEEEYEREQYEQERERERIYTEMQDEEEQNQEQIVIRNHTRNTQSEQVSESSQDSIDLHEQNEYIERVSESDSDSESSIDLRVIMPQNTSTSSSDEEILYTPRTRIYNYSQRRRN